MRLILLMGLLALNAEAGTCYSTMNDVHSWRVVRRLEPNLYELVGAMGEPGLLNTKKARLRKTGIFKLNVQTTGVKALPMDDGFDHNVILIQECDGDQPGKIQP